MKGRLNRDELLSYFSGVHNLATTYHHGTCVVKTELLGQLLDRIIDSIDPVEAEFIAIHDNLIRCVVCDVVGDSLCKDHRYE